MGTHTFTESSRQIIVPATTPLDLDLTFKPPPGWRPNPGQATRLLHVRTPGGSRRPKDSEVFELKVSGHGRLIVELSGYGNDRPQFRPPLEMALPADGGYAVSYASGQVVVNGTSGATHLQPVGPLELVFGFDQPNGELGAPLAWTLDFDGLPAQPGTPPAPPPPPPGPPPGGDVNAAFRAELEALLERYALARGVDPLLLAVLRLTLARR